MSRLAILLLRKRSFPGAYSSLLRLFFLLLLHFQPLSVAQGHHQLRTNQNILQFLLGLHLLEAQLIGIRWHGWHVQLDVIELDVDHFFVGDRRAFHLLLGHSLLVLVDRLGLPYLLLEALHLLLVDDNCEGVMRSVGVAISAGVALASSVQVEVGYLFGVDVDVLDIHTEVFKFLDLANIVPGGEELDEPAVDYFGRHVFMGIGVFSFEVEIVPELEVGVAFVGLCKLVEHWLQASDVFLQLSINIKMLQICQLFLQFHPILKSSSHMDVDNATSFSFTSVIEVLLARVHDQGSGEDSFEQASAAKIALQFLYNPLHSILLDFIDDSMHERLPVIQIFISLHDQLFLPRVHHERKSEFLCVVVDVFGEPQHDHHPYLIRLDLQVSVLHVSLVEGREKPIIRAIRKFGVLHIGENLSSLLFLPQISAVAVFVGVAGFPSCQFLNRNGPVALVNLLEGKVLVFHLLLLLLLELLPDLIEKGHNQLILLGKQKEQKAYI